MGSKEWQRPVGSLAATDLWTPGCNRDKSIKTFDVWAAVLARKTAAILSTTANHTHFMLNKAASHPFRIKVEEPRTMLPVKSQCTKIYGA